MPSIPALIDQLDDPAMCRIATAALIDLGPDVVEELSKTMLASGIWERKTRLAFVLGKIGDPWAAQAIFEVAKELPNGNGHSAVQALRRLNALDQLIDLCDHASGYYRRIIITELGWIKSEKIIDPLKQALSDPDEWTRSHAIEKLGQLGAFSEFSELERFFDDPAPPVWRSAIEIGIKLAPVQTIQWLATMLTEGNSFKRGELLSWHKFSSLAPHLIQPILICLTDKDPNVRFHAGLHLNRQGLPELLPTLLNVINHDEDGYVRDRMILDLQQVVYTKQYSRRFRGNGMTKNAEVYFYNPLLDARTIDCLFQRLNDPSPRVRASAAEVLGYTHDPQVVPFLCAHLEKESDEQVREYVLHALVSIGTEQAMDAFFQAPTLSSNHRYFVADSLAKWSSKKGLDHVWGIFDSTNSKARATLARMLGLMRETSAVERLVKALSDPDPDVFGETVHALAKIGSPEATGAIRHLLNKPIDPWVRIGIFNEFAARKDTAILDIMILALRDDNQWVHACAADSLGQLGEAKAIGPLIELLLDPSKKRRFRSAQALGRLSAVEAIPALIQVLYEGYRPGLQQLTCHAAWALGELHSVQAVPDLIQMLHVFNHNDHVIEMDAICEALGKIADPRALDELIAVLDNDYDYLPRQKAVWALGKIRDPRAVPALIAQLSDSVIGVRSATISALGQIKDPSAALALVSILENEQDAGWMAALKSLSKNGHPQAIPPLLKALSNPSPKICKLAGRALTQTGEAAVAPMLDLLSDPDPLRRRQMVWILGKIGGTRVVEKLISALDDPDWRVRYKAVQALGKIKDGAALQALEKALKDPAPQVRVPASAVFGKG